MSQIARNLTDCDERFLKEAHYLIHDRDPLFTRSFREILKSSGVETGRAASMPRCRGIHRVRSRRPESSGARRCAIETCATLDINHRSHLSGRVRVDRSRRAIRLKSFCCSWNDPTPPTRAGHQHSVM
jgi:hypothetical protein